MNRYYDQYQLPNGLSIYHKNTYETDYVYNEIFNEHTYLQHDIKINENAVIFDVGANIGLFSLYIKQNYPTSIIYAFEPSPEIHHILNSNLTEFGQSAKTFNIGLADRTTETTFYYYPEFSVISGFHANQKRDAEIILSGINCNNKKEVATVINQRLATLLPYKCQVRTLSNIIKSEKITTIDLLKIDVEGSELAILKGISEDDWCKVKQIVMEVHSKNELDLIMDILKSQSFHIAIEADKRLKDVNIYNLYAISKCYE